MILQYWLFLFLLVGGVMMSIILDKLTITAAITGGLLSIVIFLGTGFTGIALLGLFFLLGTLATSWRFVEKIGYRLASPSERKRTTGQVMANAGVAGFMGLLCWMFPVEKELFLLMMAASLSSATADTLSSELGSLYGKRFYDITSLKPGTRGENGVISLEGILFGIAGSILVAIVHGIGWGWSNQFFLIVLCGTLGNLADSVLGATLERKQYVGNNVVNFLNTAIAAVFTLILVNIF